MRGAVPAVLATVLPAGCTPIGRRDVSRGYYAECLRVALGEAQITPYRARCRVFVFRGSVSFYHLPEVATARRNLCQPFAPERARPAEDRKGTRLNSSH